MQTALRIAATFALSVGLLSFARAEKIQLKLNLPKGDSKVVSSDSDMNTTVTAGDANQNIKMKLIADVAFDVQDVASDGTLTVGVTQKRVQLDVQGGIINMSYDSDKPADPNNPAGQLLGALIGKSVAMKFDSLGRPLEVLNADKMAEEAQAKSPQMAGNIKQQLDNMKDSMSQLITPLPEQPVDTGDSWKSKYKMATDPSSPMTVEATYTIKDRNNGVAHVALEGTMSSSNGSGGTMTGNLEIDEKTGWTKKAAFDIKMAGKMSGADIKSAGTVTNTSK